MSYAVRNDGQGWRAVEGPQDIEAYEVFSQTEPLPSSALLTAQHNGPLKSQLAELDAKLIRTLHEALLALAANGAALPADTLQRLNDIQAQKSSLRAQLQ